jgi:hypothetical protein
MTPTVSRLEQRIRAVEHSVGQLRQEFEAQTRGESLDDRWLRLLTAVEEAGGDVSAAEWANLGLLCGYDPRGLGGFFRGNEPSMRADGDRRIITSRGIAYLDEFRRRR